MAQITTDDIRYLATLSSLYLTDEEVSSMQSDIANILTYVEQLSELNTDGVEPTYQVTDLENVWRTDDINDYGLDGESLVSLSPEHTDNQIKVPKVL
jgi:aspartyl-tRNA(Asn)/glutamyl-tRNA(Gln) amidotransferase subunit C